MKAAALICRTKDGGLVPLVSDSVVPLIALAKAARASGEVESGGQRVAVVRGVVLSSNAMGPVFQFTVRGEVPASNVEAVAEVKPPASNVEDGEPGAAARPRGRKG